MPIHPASEAASELLMESKIHNYTIYEINILKLLKNSSEIPQLDTLMRAMQIKYFKDSYEAAQARYRRLNFEEEINNMLR